MLCYAFHCIARESKRVTSQHGQNVGKCFQRANEDPDKSDSRRFLLIREAGEAEQEYEYIPGFYLKRL